MKTKCFPRILFPRIACEPRLACISITTAVSGYNTSVWILLVALFTMLAQHPLVDALVHSLPTSTLRAPDVRSVGTKRLTNRTGAVPLALFASEASVHDEAAATPSPRPQLRAIIFDKDGTLISFDATWSTWADSFIDRVGARCGGEKARHAVAKTIGYDMAARKVLGEKALLAYAAQPLIREAVCNMLESDLSYERTEAEKIMTEVWKECEDEDVLGISKCTKTLFTTLKNLGLRIAVCTSDARSATIKNLEVLGVVGLVDEVVCGDDDFGRPKPDPHNALYICRKLNCLPEEVALVGDTNADLIMGRRAGLGLVVGVLSGVGSNEDLAPNAHVMLESVDQIGAVLGLESNN